MQLILLAIFVVTVGYSIDNYGYSKEPSKESTPTPCSTYTSEPTKAPKPVKGE